ncbi:EamA family transporter RarD [Marihabitans asiaticum]|uniref:Chloramphenicol-sensitive protein RarD n=1 Tax=Marihabitans asiaticum TaxID=415218 RepID=A0A560WHK4_9MICO|nr:EamA family transporter RarD [Marihabitans asiaticum]TWD17152.1 chloramphenicol-sensitive protein RarD [Marihabitans asiaticum]
MSAPQSDAAAAEHRRGLLAGWGAYGIWGLFPLYFTALEPSGAWEILAHRIVWTLVLCAAILLLRRELLGLLSLLRSRPRLALGVAIAAYVIAINWGFYVYAVSTGRTHEAALGYFLNPIVTVGMGVLILRERLRPLQWAAVAIGAAAFGYLAVSSGQIPWLSIILAFSFATYGLTKKRLGASLPALQSLSAETIALIPLATGILLWLTANGEGTFTAGAPWHPMLLVLSGVATAVPLLLFAAAARRIPLVTIGLIQFITPVAQLLVGVFLLHEVVPSTRWVGFAIVWVALVVLSADSLAAARRSRRSRRAPQPSA